MAECEKKREKTGGEDVGGKCESEYEGDLMFSKGGCAGASVLGNLTSVYEIGEKTFPRRTSSVTFMSLLQLKYLK